MRQSRRPFRCSHNRPGARIGHSRRSRRGQDTTGAPIVNGSDRTFCNRRSRGLRRGQQPARRPQQLASCSRFSHSIDGHSGQAGFRVRLLVSLVAGVLFGAVPLRQIWKNEPNQAIKGGVAMTPCGDKWVFRDLLLAIQIAICCLLVTSSLVALRGLDRTLHAKFGFDPNGVSLAVSICN